MTDARTLTEILGGGWHGSAGTAPCPVCQPERRRDQHGLSVAEGADGRVLLRCFKSSCDFRSILAAAGIAPGPVAAPDPMALARRREAAARAAERTARIVAAIWREAGPIEGTLAERYLRHRGIHCTLPGTLRFHGSCWHASGARLPAMVAAVTRENAPGIVAVHRTYLREPGRKAEVAPVKAMLGPVAGGAVRLSEGDGPLVIGEGIETCLALLDGLAAHRPAVRAALSASGMAGLILPARPGELVIAPDGDPPGARAAEVLAERAHRAGWSVRIMPAPGPGLDWADVAAGNCSRIAPVARERAA